MSRYFRDNHFCMKGLFLIICLSFAVNSCRTSNNWRQVVKFYHRDKLGDAEAGSLRYSDYLAINNYEAKPATARKLLQLANLYLDTVHAKLAIEVITFMAKNVESPKLIWDSEIASKESKYFLIDFAYVHSIFENENRNRQLNSITIWRHGEPTTYYPHYYYTKNGERVEGTNFIDSILNSSVALVND